MKTRRALSLLVLSAGWLAGACKPDLGAPPSLVLGPRLLAVRANPPEAQPADAQVTYDALLVDDDGGQLVSVGASAQVGWAICDEPHPPAESNIVSRACLDIPEEATGATFMAKLPGDACINFGPLTSKPGTRPADPDVTGGYYQPVRVVWHTSAGDDQTAFALERILCRLGSIAPTEIAGEYASNYMRNTNPVLTAATLDPDGAATPLFAVGQTSPPAPATVAAGQAVTLEVVWSDTTPETFLVYDIISHTLVSQRETLRVSWFATAGAFEHDRSGRGEGESETFTRNVWTAPATPGTVRLWLVLRDSRGGVDFAEAEVDVTP